MAASVAKQLRNVLDERAEEIAAEWLARLLERLPESPARVFPDKTLLNHIPLLLRHIAAALEGETDIHQPDVVEELENIARLRRAQGYSHTELVSEFDILEDIVLQAVEDQCDKLVDPTPTEIVRAARRLNIALSAVTRICVDALGTNRERDLAERALLLNEFGHTVSHELRNRLNAASLALDALDLDLEVVELPEGSQALVAKLRERLQRVETVVEDVFAVAIAHGRIDPGDKQFRPFVEVVREICDSIREHAKQQQVEVRVADELPRFTVDGMRLYLVLFNLLSNAVKYSDPEKSNRFVAVSTQRVDDRHWQVSVRDNGRGIPPEHHDTIFERAERGDAPESVAGQGIGLWVAGEAVKQLGGRIWLDSERGQGTTFHFTVSEPALNLPE